MRVRCFSGLFPPAEENEAGDEIAYWTPEKISERRARYQKMAKALYTGSRRKPGRAHHKWADRRDEGLAGLERMDRVEELKALVRSLEHFSTPSASKWMTFRLASASFGENSPRVVSSFRTAEHCLHYSLFWAAVILRRQGRRMEGLPK